MRFFYIMGATLAIIGLINLISATTQLAMRDPVYACSEVTSKDPIDVQKICRGKAR
mgnify:CR=1 FL=1